MTSRRYQAYRLVVNVATQTDHPELKEIAEALLLTRGSPIQEIRTLERAGALELSRMVVSGDLRDTQAEKLWVLLKDCGPAELAASVPEDWRSLQPAARL